MTRARSRGAHAASHRAPRAGRWKPSGPMARTAGKPGLGAGGEGKPGFSIRARGKPGLKVRAGDRPGGPPPAGDKRAGETGVSGGRLRSARVRIVAAAAAVAVLGIGIGLGGASPEPSAEPTVQAFLLAWENAQYSAAAALTTGRPATVATALRGAYQQLGAADLSLGMAGVREHGDTAEARFNASVDLGRSATPWSYRGSFTLRRTGSRWRVVWSPAVIVPGLRPGMRLAVISTMPPRAQLLDASGKPLTPRDRVYEAGVRPGALRHPGRTASTLAQVTGLAAAQILGWIRGAPSTRFLELIRFSRPQYHRLAEPLSRVPGLIIRPERERLFGSVAKRVAGSVGTEASEELRREGVPYRPGSTVGLSGLQRAFQHRLVGSATTEVVEENRAGRVLSVLKRWPGNPGRPVQTTIDEKVQLAADSAVQSAAGSAAIIAVSPGSGRILGVAGHKAAGMPAIDPLDGRYQPGQAFTIISTAALLDHGFAADTPTPCTASNEVGGQNFVNDPPVPDLGVQPPFRTDFAHACSTAFAGLSLRLSAKDLTSAASGFGLGRQWHLPLSAFSGSMTSPADYAQLAEDVVGTGSVQVSPLDMALAAAVVRSGTWHSPSLVTNPPDPGLSPRVPFGNEVVSALRGLMRATVTEGLGRAADVGQRPAYGQVGSAPLASHKGLRTAWFVGFSGNVAFAAVQLTKSASTSAAPLAGRFLASLARS